MPDAWKTAAAEEIEAPGSPLETWWTTLNDPKLLELIHEARLENLALQTAAARVEEARARLGIATGQYYPDLIVDGSYSRIDPSENSTLIPLPGASDTFDLYNLGVGFGWEIDVFGRLRRGAESARAGLEASIEDYRDVMVILMADVAANYVEVRTLQERIKYGRANVEAQSGSLQLTQDRFDAGLSPLTDVTQAEYNLANSQAAIPALEARLAAAINRAGRAAWQAAGRRRRSADGRVRHPRPRRGRDLGNTGRSPAPSPGHSRRRAAAGLTDGPDRCGEGRPLSHLLADGSPGSGILRQSATSSTAAAPPGRWSRACAGTSSPPARSATTSGFRKPLPNSSFSPMSGPCCSP